MQVWSLRGSPCIVTAAELPPLEQEAQPYVAFRGCPSLDLAIG